MTRREYGRDTLFAISATMADTQHHRVTKLKGGGTQVLWQTHGVSMLLVLPRRAVSVLSASHGHTNVAINGEAHKDVSVDAMKQLLGKLLARSEEKTAQITKEPDRRLALELHRRLQIACVGFRGSE